MPIRLGYYAEGLFVERIEKRQAHLAGARLVAIGGVPIEQALELVAPVIRHDNRMQLFDLLPMHLVLTEVLAARGLASSRDSARFELETSDGRRHHVELAASVDERAVTWSPALAGAPREALSLRDLRPGEAPRRGAFTRENWLARAPSCHCLYLQYNRVENLPDRSIVDLAQQLGAELAAGGVDRVVVDLRWNWGGDNSLSEPLLHALISSEVTRRPAGLIVLIGRGTFSAGMMFALALEQHLRPIFVGEPTGSTPNHFGDSRKVRLPNSNLTLRISTLWWQISDPRDTRNAIGVELAAPPSWQELVAGHDGALALALAPAQPIGIPTGGWRGLLAVSHEEAEVELNIAGDEATLHIQDMAEPIALKRVPSDLARLRLEGKAPFGIVHLGLIRLADRLVGQLVVDAESWRPNAIGLTPATMASGSSGH